MADENGRDGQLYEPAGIERRLTQELPLWYREDGCICRKYRTGGWKATLMVVNCIGHLAEAAFHHPDLSVSYAAVIVRLTTHSAGGGQKTWMASRALGSRWAAIRTWSCPRHFISGSR